MDEITIDELKTIERADKIVKRLSEALYCDAEDDNKSSYHTTVETNPVQ